MNKSDSSEVSFSFLIAAERETECWFFLHHVDSWFIRRLYKIYFFNRMNPGRKKRALRRQAPRCCKTATDLWLNGHFVMREGRNASTQVSVEACWGVYHYDCFRNWNGLFIVCQSHQEHTHTQSCVWLLVLLLLLFFFFWQMDKATNL